MSKAPALKVELWPIEKVIPYEGNAKKHPQDQVKKLAAAITKFGWTQPIVVDRDGVIIAGHGRRLAAIFLELKRVPVVCRTDLSKAEADALRLADNRVASTEYDTGLIQMELARLSSEGFELDSLGFDAKELEFLTADHAMFDESAFVDDIVTAVDDQRAENEKRVAELDESAAPLVDAFGFKRITVAQSRKIRVFMSLIEDMTGKKGVDALMDHVDRCLAP